MKTLEQQIEALKAEHIFKSEMETLIGNYNVLSYIHNGVRTVNIDIRNDDGVNTVETLIKDILNIFAPDYSVRQTTDYRGRIVVNAKPFYVSFKNPAKYERSYVMLRYMSKSGISVSLKIDASHYSHLHTGTRRVTNCEYHYFEGVRIGDMPSIPIVYPAIFNTLAYSGGEYTIDQTCMNVESLARLQDYIITGK